MDLMRWIQKQKRHRDDVALQDDGHHNERRQHRSKSIDPESLNYLGAPINLAHHQKHTPQVANLLVVETNQRRRSDDLGLAEKKRSKSKHKRLFDNLVLLNFIFLMIFNFIIGGCQYFPVLNLVVMADLVPDT